MDYRSQSYYYRAQRRGPRRRGYFGGIGGIIWLIIIISLFSGHGSFLIFPWLLIGLPFFFWVLRPMLWGRSNQQQPDAQPYVQPGAQQPDQPAQYAAPQEPIYQPYNQGYTAQQTVNEPHEAYVESSQPNQYEVEQHTQQYEEPMTIYPQE
ncbi:MAG TPA: hypothetical protein VGD98_12795 [Ktedonobacteraceae bacterium]